MGRKLKQLFHGKIRLDKPEEWNLVSPAGFFRGSYEIVSEPVGRVGRLWASECRQPLAIARESWPAGGVFVPSGWLHGRGSLHSKESGVTRYRPDTRDLLLDVQRLKVTAPDQLLGFLSRWGPLGIGAQPPDDGRMKDFFLFDGVAATVSHLLRVQKWREAFYALQRGTSSSATWSSLADGLYAHLAEVRLSAQPRDRGLRVCYVAARLIDLIWLEAWDSATQGKRLRRCRECGALFLPSRRNQTHCTHLCANRPAVRKWKRNHRVNRGAGGRPQ